ncbi:ATP-binding protein [Acidobacteria bacterium AH-259-D05]|nr:ATP-binding protein [Acidobacteria bacterium AH-259-D05]
MKSQATETCSTCRGSGWLVKTQEAVETVVPCPECRAQERLHRLLEKAAIPPRYFDRGFEEYSFHNKLQQRAQMRAIEYVEAFPDVPRGLLFAGPCGVGKTHLSVAILKTLIQEKMVTASFVDEAELLRRLQYSYGPDSPETEREVLIPLSEVDLLVWDDLGTGRPTDWVRETIRTVINHRYTYKKQTILSTNWPLQPETKSSQRSRVLTEKIQESLAERIGLRLFSRIMEMCEIVEIEGPDFRTDIDKAGKDFRRAQTNDSHS